MGLISSMCKRKPRVLTESNASDDYIQRGILKKSTLDSSTSDQTQCSAMSREPYNNSSMRYHYYIPKDQQIYSTSMQSIRGDPDLPLFSTPFYIPFNGKTPSSNSTSYHRSNPYVAQAYNHLTAIAKSPFPIRPTDRVRTTFDKETGHPPEATVGPAIDDDEEEQQQQKTIARVETSISTDVHQRSPQETRNDGSRLIKRTTSAPIDMFLIDISNEHVLIGQPVSMNIRHLVLDTIENHQGSSLKPIRIEPSSMTTYARENLLDYIPYVCERYPNPTVESDRLTRSTLHVRVPSQFSRSLNVLS